MKERATPLVARVLHQPLPQPADTLTEALCDLCKDVILRQFSTVCLIVFAWHCAIRPLLGVEDHCSITRAVIPLVFGLCPVAIGSRGWMLAPLGHQPFARQVDAGEYVGHRHINVRLRPSKAWGLAAFTNVHVELPFAFDASHVGVNQ